MITLKRFCRIERAVRAAGYGSIVDWSEIIPEPASADEFASEAIYVICNSEMMQSVGALIAERCLKALAEGASATTVFRHPGKASAIDDIWQRRDELFAQYRAAEDKIGFCDALPWIGPVTRYHLAKNFGVDTAKPDIHLERLARRDGTTTHKLCERLSRLTGYKIATIDTILWRACADGIIDSRRYEQAGWRAAFNGKLEVAPIDGPSD